MAKKLYVGNLPYTITEDTLAQKFSEAGEIASVTIITDRMSGRSKGFGFVEFKDDKAAEKAISLFDGKDFDGRKIIVNEARPPRQQ